jgi:hypothetical protein
MSPCRDTPRVELRCGRGHRHEPSAHYDIGNGTCYCRIRPCVGIRGGDAARIRWTFWLWTGYVRDAAEGVARGGWGE